MLCSLSVNTFGPQLENSNCSGVWIGVDLLKRVSSWFLIIHIHREIRLRRMDQSQVPPRFDAP